MVDGYKIDELVRPDIQDMRGLLEFLDGECYDHDVLSQMRFGKPDGILHSDELQFDIEKNGVVDSKDYEYFKDYFDNQHCHPSGQIPPLSESLFIRAKRHLAEVVLAREIVPQLVTAGLMSDTAAHDATGPERQALTSLAHHLDVSELPTFFQKFLPFFVSSKLVQKSGDLSVDPGGNGLIVVDLFRLRDLWDPNERESQVVRSWEEASRLAAVLRSFKDYENFKIPDDAVPFLENAVHKEDLASIAELKYRVAVGMLDKIRNGTPYDNEAITVFDFLEDAQVPVEWKQKLVDHADSLFRNEQDDKKIGHLARFLAREASHAENEKDAYVKSVRILFMEWLIRALDPSRSEEHLLKIVGAVLDAWGSNVPQEQQVVVERLRILASDRRVPLILRAAIYFWFFDDNGASQAFRREARRFLASRGITGAWSKTSWKLSHQPMARDFMRGYVWERFEEANLDELFILFRRHYGNRFLPNWLSSNESIAELLAWEEVLEQEEEFYRIIQQNPDLRETLMSEEAWRVYRIFRGSFRQLEKEVTYEFAQFVKTPKEDRDRAIRFYRRLKAQKEYVSFNGVDSFAYLTGASKLPSDAQEILFKEVLPKMVSRDDRLDIRDVFFWGMVATQDQRIRTQVCDVLIPWLKGQSIDVVSSDIPAILQIQQELEASGESLDQILAALNAYGADANPNLDLSDFFFYAVNRRLLPERQALLDYFASAQLPDVHRKDSNFSEYTSYGNWKTFTTIDLAKMYVFRQHYLLDEGKRRFLGTALDHDIEIGFAPLFSGGRADLKRFVFRHPFARLLYNDTYQAPKDHAVVDATTLAFIHTHPLYGCEGPSGAFHFGFMWAMGTGDIYSATYGEEDGIVLSWMEGRRFAVHFYDSRRNVVCLGIYPAD